MIYRLCELVARAVPSEHGEENINESASLQNIKLRSRLVYKDFIEVV